MPILRHHLLRHLLQQLLPQLLSLEGRHRLCLPLRFKHLLRLQLQYSSISSSPLPLQGQCITLLQSVNSRNPVPQLC